jgi:predicted amidohydrolase YtcJ
VPADLILQNGVVHTVSASRQLASGIAVADGHIVAIGGPAELAAFRGPATREIDLQGGMLLPGFIDAHCHPAMGGHGMTQCTLHDITGREPTRQAIGEYAGRHPERDWVLGGGWSMGDFPGGLPTREELDAVVADRPVALTNRDCHGMWVNSRALEAAGITDSTPDPDGGRIERDTAGRATGVLQEQAMQLVYAIAPEPTPADRIDGIRQAQAYYHGLGITSWADAVVEAETQAAYTALAASGELTMRVRAMLSWDPAGDIGQLDDLIERRAAGRIGRLSCDEVKFFHDGVFENGTGAMLDPYLDARRRPTSNYGLDQYDLDDLARYVVASDLAGFQVHIHTIGDRAVRECLDIFEHAIEMNGRRDARHHLAHLEFVHPADVPRLRALNVTANVTPLWAQREDSVTVLTLPFVSDAVARTIYPFRSIHAAGGRLAFGSDWSVSTPEPLEQLATAVSRFDPRGTATDPLFAEECLDLDTAIAAHTINGAYVAFTDDRTGSIEPGKLADLVVLDRDLFAGGADEIRNARTLLTLSEGAVVHAADGWG